MKAPPTVLPSPPTDENVRLIESLLGCVNAPAPMSLRAANAPFQWALSVSRERAKALRHRVTFHADEPAEQARVVELARRARSTARSLLWWIAATNDLALDKPVLLTKSGRPRLSLYSWGADEASLLEAPMEFGHYVARKGLLTGNEPLVEKHTVTLWDRPSTCIGHALDLLLSDYRGLRARLRACPYLPRGTLADWDTRRINKDISRGNTMHFFVDARFEKGQEQYYCTIKHRQTAYMRSYRPRAAARLAKHK